MKAIIDPRKFISLVGESNAQYNKESKIAIETTDEDEFNDDNFEVDIDLDLLREMTDDSVTSASKDVPSSLPKDMNKTTENSVSADTSNNQKKPTKRKKNTGEL